jgi:NAD(P)H-hydrate epimerase
MAARSAMESGVGLVTVASNSQTIQSIQSTVPSLMGLELKESESFFHESSLEQVLGFQKNVLLVGPGGGVQPETLAYFRELILNDESPLVLDADALRAFHSPEDAFECLRKREAPTILTPHPGEFSALTGIPSREIENQKLEAVREFVRNSSSILVLKGASTVVATPSGQERMFYYPNSALAKAGSGDVLAGIISSLMCQGFSAVDSAFNGVRLHAAAASIMADRYSSYSSTPLKLIESISPAIQNYLNSSVSQDS